MSNLIMPWRDRVVPVTMELCWLYSHVFEFSARDLHPGGIALLVQAGSDLQPGLRGGAPDQLDDHLVTDQRLPAPVLGDVAEHAMLDLVPLAGAGREVADGDPQPRLRGHLMQPGFPESGAVAVTHA